MTVVPFPARRPPDPEPGLADPISAEQVVAALVAALSVLGEPATAAEIAQLVAATCPALADCDEASMALWLARFGRTGGPGGGAIVRPVGLRGAEAWAFTPSFREVLRDAGIPLVLRALPDA